MDKLSQGSESSLPPSPNNQGCLGFAVEFFSEARSLLQYLLSQPDRTPIEDQKVALETSAVTISAPIPSPVDAGNEEDEAPRDSKKSKQDRESGKQENFAKEKGETRLKGVHAGVEALKKAKTPQEYMRLEDELHTILRDRPKISSEDLRETKLEIAQSSEMAHHFFVAEILRNIIYICQPGVDFTVPGFIVTEETIVEDFEMIFKYLEANNISSELFNIPQRMLKIHFARVLRRTKSDSRNTAELQNKLTGLEQEISDRRAMLVAEKNSMGINTHDDVRKRTAIVNMEGKELTKKTSETPAIIDGITRKMTAALRISNDLTHIPEFKDIGLEGRDSNRTREPRVCGCSVAPLMTTASAWTEVALPDGKKTQANALHYVAFHRQAIDQADLDFIQALPFGEEEPTPLELMGVMNPVVQAEQDYYLGKIPAFPWPVKNSVE